MTEEDLKTSRPRILSVRTSNCEKQETANIFKDQQDFVPKQENDQIASNMQTQQIEEQENANKIEYQQTLAPEQKHDRLTCNLQTKHTEELENTNMIKEQQALMPEENHKNTQHIEEEQENAIKIIVEEAVVSLPENEQKENVQATLQPIENLLKETINPISENFKLEVNDAQHKAEENKENSACLIQISSPARSSLRHMTRDLLAKDSTKSVTFSPASPTVHQLPLREEHEDEKSGAKIVEKTSRQIKTKSGLVVVRNIVFKPPRRNDN